MYELWLIAVPPPLTFAKGCARLLTLRLHSMAAFEQKQERLGKDTKRKAPAER